VTDGLRRFRELANRHGFTPLVAIWPRFLDDRIADVCFMPGSNEQLIVEHLAAMHGIPSVRLSKSFQQHDAALAGAASPRLRYSQGDELHPSVEGCRVAAEALKQVLDNLDAGVVPLTHEVTRSDQCDAQAMAATRALGQAQPNYARVYNRIGTELFEAGKLTEAVAQFQQALEADPSHAGAYNNLGVAYERMGKEEAQEQFEEAIRLRPDFAQAHFNLARILIQKRRDGRAAAELQHTIQIDPNHVGALNMLGTVLGRQQKFSEATSYLERAVRLDPNHAEAHSNLGAAYAGLGRLREAVAQFEVALRIDPNEPGALENLKRVKAALQE
jgi:Flp pilus assembly protein TadD